MEEANKKEKKQKQKKKNNGCLAIAIIVIVVAVIIIGFPFFLIVLIAGGIDFDDTGSGIAGSPGITECGFTISATSLSKEEYKSKLEEYASTKNANFEIFASNADSIYDYARSKNINPELVAVRAYVEGRGSTTGLNNYWGMGCVNEGGLEACYDYSSFAEGYTDFVNNISQYNSLADMMSKYAYIGEYWYNPGNSGIGGCYYASYIYDEELMPVRVQNACAETAPVCTTANKTNCTETTDEDQLAYATWQVEQNMASARLSIFGLDMDDGPCTNNSGNIQHLSAYNLNAEGLTVLNRTLTTTEVQNLNKYITTEVDSAGYGTGDGVAAAGQALTYWLEQQGYYLQYYWGGGHGGYGDGDITYTGVNSNWGSSAYGCDDKGRCYFGFDCSGFVSWAIRTSCNPNYGSRSANFKSYGMDHGAHVSISEAKPGDLMLTSGHVRLVVKNNGDGSVITAESKGGDDGGLVFTKRFADSSYEFISMSNYYQKNCKSSR